MSTNLPEPSAPDGEVEVTTKLKVEGAWYEFVMGGSEGYLDMFSRDYCGYWLQHVKTKKGVGFLARLDDPEDHAKLSELELKALVKAWLADPTIALPEGYFTLNRAVAEKGYIAAVDRFGVNWFDELGDSDSYDYAVQCALLGELVYG